jgi:hypothetical protein
VARFVLPTLAMLVLACASEMPSPSAPPTAAIAAYCLVEPFTPYASGRGDAVGWATHDGGLFLHFERARRIEIPAGQPSCGAEWELVEAAGATAPVLGFSYAVHPEGGFVLGFDASEELLDRFASLSTQDRVVIAYGPARSAPIGIDAAEDLDLRAWLVAAEDD